MLILDLTVTTIYRYTCGNVELGGHVDLEEYKKLIEDEDDTHVNIKLNNFEINEYKNTIINELNFKLLENSVK